MAIVVDKTYFAHYTCVSNLKKKLKEDADFLGTFKLNEK